MINKPGIRVGTIIQIRGTKDFRILLPRRCYGKIGSIRAPTFQYFPVVKIPVRECVIMITWLLVRVVQNWTMLHPTCIHHPVPISGILSFRKCGTSVMLYRETCDIIRKRLRQNYFLFLWVYRRQIYLILTRFRHQSCIAQLVLLFL